jgi:FixJ family two-component response regulator
LNHTVFIIDDDDSVRQSLERLLRAEGIRSESFDSARRYLARDPYDGIGCLLLDVAMPGTSGIELQVQLAAQQRDLPIIFLTGHGDIPMSVQAMKRGAFDFLTKPVDESDLLRVVRQALAHHQGLRERVSRHSSAGAQFDALTARERDVMQELITGAPNKVVAERLQIAVKTVKVHRANLMKKLGIRSVAELVHLWHLTGEGIGD